MNFFMDIRDKVFAATGKVKADTIFFGGLLINVNTKEMLYRDIAVKEGYIVGIGDVSSLKGDETEMIDVTGKHLCPGLMDGHVHFESSMVTLSQFAVPALAHGTTSVVIDPHEIANVLGRGGIELVLDEAATLPLNAFVAVSSCVPATSFETAGASIDVDDIVSLIANENVVGLGEMMDYPGVVFCDETKLSMIRTALKERLVVDGHCPALSREQLFGYMCAGISTDHESIEYEEALEKLRLGMKLMIREGSAAKALDKFLPRLIGDGVSLENVFFVTDDKHPSDLLKGYMDVIVRRAIELGLSPLDAISMCTINAAKHYRVDHIVGSLSMGRKADIIVLEDLEKFIIDSVYASGRPVESFVPSYEYPDTVFNTVKFDAVTATDLQIMSDADKDHRVRVIKVVPDLIVTENETFVLHSDRHGILMPDVENDVLSVAVIERHGKNGNIGTGFIKGMGLRNGAIGQSIGHDSHNVVVTGVDHSDMALCANTIRSMNGGICVVSNGKVVEQLELPFAGLLSTLPAEEVEKKLTDLHKAVKEIGCALPAPFITHSFIALPVIPSLRLTDMGLFDVDKFSLVSPIDEVME
ncbi:Adenine deaminase [Methanococcoides burtonii DSM 6242]|uniref:Adenine deaminase n=2 Tax=Methanococcoides burtonii TaxID=29291 RepID=ADEC_METBU|nr:RecName: Full=Adenine deaminase; Short=Adenase; Short=Adenine aminase [Methanococcoides burtonii DSM 6242]ABE51698.1 Adenine deaminase [Methanococcoides burtonii DSM 6242]